MLVTPDQAERKRGMQTRMLPSLLSGRKTADAKLFFLTPRSRQARSR